MAGGTFTNFPEPPEVPESPLLSRRFRVPGLAFELRPLTGPAIDIPAEQDEELQARFEAFKAGLGQLISLPEFIAFEFLLYKKQQIENVDFTFQSPILGGRTEFGGFVLDFFIIGPRYGWRIQGERWHLLQPASRARDDVARALLESDGIRVIDLWEDDVITRSDFVLEKAWMGEQVKNVRDVF